MKTDIDDLYELIDSILKHRDSVFSLWGKNEDREQIFLGLFPDEESARVASIFKGDYKYITGLIHERKQI